MMLLFSMVNAAEPYCNGYSCTVSQPPKYGTKCPQGYRKEYYNEGRSEIIVCARNCTPEEASSCSACPGDEKLCKLDVESHYKSCINLLEKCASNTLTKAQCDTLAKYNGQYNVFWNKAKCVTKYGLSNGVVLTPF